MPIEMNMKRHSWACLALYFTCIFCCAGVQYSVVNNNTVHVAGGVELRVLLKFAYGMLRVVSKFACGSVEVR